ncbi:hypothetical protein SSZBM1_128 [Synechococcus phage S-SZBM1]|uniref:Uncharacterized protein n=1 Tax=Synechococcus phage S-SZBM1 TaxID=2926475 RepID=A0AC61TSL9_9CAUD|nr:hypothetical protein PP650_gp148 [Synechococcus phage S-SZBM1]UNH61245.1 hypothetical protein SSZBM1_128 [Synechococcus phage S-SZBM1]
MSEKKHSQDFSFEFDITFGGGEENVFQKWKRWAAKKPFPISFFLDVLISVLEAWVIEGKVNREMHLVDMQVKEIQEEWDVQEKEEQKPIFSSRPSEVEGLDEIRLTAPWHRDSGESDWLSERPESWYQGPLEIFEETEEGPSKG